MLQEHVIDARIFATDVDEASIERGRTGVFADVDAVSADRRARWFRPEQDAFAILRPLRERVVFGIHDLFGDPPLAKLDLVSCRNLLIYLDEQRQEWLLRLFHFALRPGGLLFLGSAESIGVHDALFEPVDARWRIYRRREGVTSAMPMALPAPSRLPATTHVEHDATQALAARFVPPSLVVDRDGFVVHVHGRVASLFVPDHTPDSIHALVPALSEIVGSMLAMLAGNDDELVVPSVTVDGGTVDVLGFAVREPAQLRGLYVFVFDRARGVHSANDPRASHWATLARELRRARHDQRVVVDSLTTANRELTAMNESLQTANEELQTTRDDLVAASAELRVVNAALERTLGDHARAADDLANVLAQLDVGVVILDRSLRIVRYTPEATRLWALGEEDRGLPIDEIVSPGVMRQLVTVLETLTPCTLVVEAEAVCFELRVAPYRTSDHAIEGLVLAFAERNHGEE